MKTYFTLLLAAALCLQAQAEKRIVSMSYTSSNSYDTETTVTQFRYDASGRVSFMNEIEEDGDRREFMMNYDENQVRISASELEPDEFESAESAIYELQDGLLYTIGFVDENGSNWGRFTFQDERLLQYYYQGEFYEDGNGSRYSETFNYTWNGDLMPYGLETYHFPYNFDEPAVYRSNEITYSDKRIPEVNCFCMTLPLTFEVELEDLPSALVLHPFMGKLPPYQVEKITRTYYDQVLTYNFNYEFEGDYLTRITSVCADEDVATTFTLSVVWEEAGSASVEEVTPTAPTVVDRHDAGGRRIGSGRRGMQILRMSDGSVRKAFF